VGLLSRAADCWSRARPDESSCSPISAKRSGRR
jgi:hypothetical protein